MCHRSRHGHTTDSRLGTSIGLLPLNGVESLWTLLLFSVFREPRPTKMGRPCLATPSSSPMRSGIALGSNIGDRLANLRAAYREVVNLSSDPARIRCSSIYETSPVDSPPGVASYLNAVTEIEYEKPAIALLDSLLKIERSLGRPSKRPRNAPRIIDLDLLYVGNLTLNSPEIVIPHPRISHRRFVLEPLAEIAPELVLPGQTVSIRDLWIRLKSEEEVTKIPEELYK
jgi:2-amino-4-hydroxy-6-hydroxymethyldihydropteridine diphosphokinase